MRGQGRTYRDPVSEFLVEAYEARGGGVPNLENVSLAAELLTREGTPVRLLRSILLPAEETRFYLYQADSLHAVAHAAALAGLSFERIAEATSDWTPPSGGSSGNINGGKHA